MNFHFITNAALLAGGCYLVLALAVWAFPNQSEEGIEFTLFATGADHGIIEPCGCTGGQLGGIRRRATYFEAYSYGGQPRLTLATGGLPGGVDALQRIRYEIILLSLAEFGYDAVGLGPEELALGLDTLRDAGELVGYPFSERIENPMEGDILVPFILTNVAYPAESEELPYLPVYEKEVAGARVRILALIPDSLKEKLPSEAKFIPPAKAIEEAVRRTPESEFTVVLLRGTRQEAKNLDPLIPGEGAKVILYSSPHTEARIYEFGKREGLVRYLTPGDRARYVISCNIQRNAEGILVPVDPIVDGLDKENFPESQSIQFALDWYKARVIDEKILMQMVEKKPASKGAPYIGNATCVLCHEAAHTTWLQSAHAHAYKTLVEAEREFDPECLSCHTVGFGYKTGFRSVEETPKLLDVGCECCHGPCAEHVAQGGASPTPLKADCVTCHNRDHSSSFDEKEYWAKLPCTADPKPAYAQN